MNTTNQTTVNYHQDRFMLFLHSRLKSGMKSIAFLKREYSYKEKVYNYDALHSLMAHVYLTGRYKYVECESLPGMLMIDFA